MSRMAGPTLRASSVLAALPVLTILALLVPCPAPAQEDAAAWQRSQAAWRSQYERELAAPDGWLTLVGLEWLKTGVNTVGSAPENTIRLAADAPAHAGILTVSGKAPDSVIQLLAPQGGFPAGTECRWASGPRRNP